MIYHKSKSVQSIVDKNTSTLERKFSFFLFTSFTILLWVVMIGKIAGNGVGDYLKHLTNWGWTVNALYYLVDFCGWFDRSGNTRHFLIGHFFWTLNAITWIIFWLVFFVLGDNPELLIKISTMGGGEYDLGAVFIGDRVFHVIPGIFVLLYMLLRRNEIIISTYDLIDPNKIRPIKQIVGPIIVLIIMPAVIIGTYKLFSDIEIVYGIKTPQIIIFMIGLVIVFVSNIIAFTIYYKQYMVSKFYLER